MYLLGLDVGSSSIKASLVDGEKGRSVASSFYPKQEMEIIAFKAGWAEQNPQVWWNNLKQATQDVLQKAGVKGSEISAIGISYQMHGLVLVDKDQQVLRPSIIWCDSRAVEIGDKAFKSIGARTCLKNLLNSPGNFTASKLKWVMDNEPDIYRKIHKIMLPGDYVAMKLTGEISTTASGLSEGILWNFKKNEIASLLLKEFTIDQELIPSIVPTFSEQGQLSRSAAEELGLIAGIKVAYRAGDQPNNAFSLNVLNPGEIAATAGTSGVVYGISEEIKYDKYSRVNTFAHVNHSANKPRLGVLLCINGTGILNSWVKKNIGAESLSYEDMNLYAAQSPIGSEGMVILPFGNGAERMLRNNDLGCHISGVNFNIHNKNNLFRAAQEGIVCAFNYGMNIMSSIGITPKVIRAGKSNMFLSPIFRDTLAGITGASIELYDTDGAQGAAIGAGVGSGYYKSFEEAFSGLNKLETIDPDTKNTLKYKELYQNWLTTLNQYSY
jgi:xylulokinase